MTDGTFVISHTLSAVLTLPGDGRLFTVTCRYMLQQVILAFRVIFTQTASTNQKREDVIQ